MKVFLGLWINTALIQKSRMEDYWITQESEATPYFNNVMPRDRFLMIMWNWHVCDLKLEKPRGDPDFDPIFKVRNMVTRLNEKYGQYYYPGQNISIDESLVGCKSRTQLMQYLPNKHHHRWGVKLWVLCEAATGYTVHFDVYRGKQHETYC
jgi:hypothetical protein